MTMAIPASLAKPRRMPRGLVAASIVGVLVVAVLIWKFTRPVAPVLTNSFYTVTPVDLDIVIRKDGELQAAKNLDVVCPVEGLNTIRTIVTEGSVVKKGDVIAELDSSDIKKKLQTSTLDVKKAESDYAASKVQVDLQKSKNTADLEAANVELKLARI